MTFVTIGSHHVATPAADAADVGKPHDAGDSLAAGQYALIEKFGTDAWHAISGIAFSVRCFNLCKQCDIGRSAFAWHASMSVVITAFRDFKLIAHGSHG